MPSHTLKLYLNLTIDELISSKDLTKTSPFMSSIARSTTKGKAVIVIGFLGIIVGTNLIHPEDYSIIGPILKKKENTFQQNESTSSFRSEKRKSRQKQVQSLPLRKGGKKHNNYIKFKSFNLPTQEHGADSTIRWHSTDKLGELHGFAGQTISMNKIPGNFFI